MDLGLWSLEAAQIGDGLYPHMNEVAVRAGPRTHFGASILQSGCGPWGQALTDGCVSSPEEVGGPGAHTKEVSEGPGRGPLPLSVQEL